MIPRLGGRAPAGGLDGLAPIVPELLRQQHLFWTAAMARAEALRQGAHGCALPALWTAAMGTPLQAAASDAVDYAVDAVQRNALFWDAMRQAGNGFIEHEKRGCPPVLVFDYETIVDGATLERPVNYALVRIIAPEGYQPADPALRPFVVIDPRAGHGAGIGGFKDDSEVGVALRGRHPVYFVVFSRDPMPGQTIPDVTQAERHFLSIVAARHPDAPKPVVIGNCQGGWAAVLLAATAPALVGPLVLSGAPLSYWAGRPGRGAMRYTGGLAGGSWPTALLADLGGGRFDGAHLGLNFESLSPGNTWFRKYYDVYDDIDAGSDRFLTFERWWSGLFLMNREEIRWIVENLFVGNRLVRDGIKTADGQTLSLRNIRTPVVVFASEGDNITPPAQALRWIADVYRDEHDIKSAGQTIVYRVHESVGHLGIFVSGAIARKEHTEIASLLDLIEAVAPGLYELSITGTEAGAYDVALVERTMDDVRHLCGDGVEDPAFAAVAHVSEANAMAYDMFVSPLVRGMIDDSLAEAGRKLHPMRLRRRLVSDDNPLLLGVPAIAELARAHRRPAPPHNLFRRIEAECAGYTERLFGFGRTMYDAVSEAVFFGIYGWLAPFVPKSEPTATMANAAAQPPPEEVMPIEKTALCYQGGYAEATARMLLLVARAEGGVRRDELQREKALLATQEPFASMSEAALQELIRTQLTIVETAPEESIVTLPKLLNTMPQRRRALALVRQVTGTDETVAEPTQAMLERFCELLEEGSDLDAAVAA